MRTLFRWLSGMFFISALGAVATLLVVDATNHLTLAAAHQQAGALAFMLIGASYMSLQLSSGRRLNETFKQLLLGLAFVLWGTEQFLPASPWVAVVDSAVVLIFVVDLSLIIAPGLKNSPQAKQQH